MKKIILLSELNFSSCLVCASMKIFPWDKIEVQTNFVSEEKVADTAIRLFNNNDLVVALGYKEILFSKEKISILKDKLLMLLPSEDAEEDQFVPMVFCEEFNEDTLKLMAKVVEIANEEASDENFLAGETAKDLEKADGSHKTIEETDPKIMEDLFYLQNRYIHAIKVVHSLYGFRDKVRLHKRFVTEVIRQEKNEWIDQIIRKYALMSKRTKKLIPQIRSTKKARGIGLLSIDNPYFFEEDIVKSSEEMGYLAMAIEYRTKDGKDFTIFSEKRIKNIQYFPGKIQENWDKVIYRLN